MENDVAGRRRRHLQEAAKEQINQMKRSGYKNKEIAAALKVSVRTIQRVKVLPLVKTVQVQKKAKRTRTTESQRAVERTLIKEGYTQAEVAQRTNMSKASVAYTQKRFEKTGSDRNRKCSGRPHVSTVREDRFLKRRSLQDRFRPATKLKEDWDEIGIQASTSTVRRRLRAANLMGRVARKKPLLTPSHRLRRLHFAKIHKDWTKEDWEKVLWTDEAPFSFVGQCGKTYVRRRTGEGLNPNCVTSTVKHGGGKIQVWGCFTANGVGHIHHIKGIMDQKMYRQILIHHMRPSMMQLGRKDTVIFQQDNDPKHTAKTVKDYIQRARYLVLQNWPAQSPDLNPIENLWKELKTQTYRHHPRPTNKDELFDIVKHEWEALPDNLLKKLVHSMPWHITAVMKAKGGHTKY